MFVEVFPKHWFKVLYQDMKRPEYGHNQKF